MFYGQADRKEGGALAVSKCEHFDPFFPLKFDSLKNWGFKKLDENDFFSYVKSVLEDMES